MISIDKSGLTIWQHGRGLTRLPRLGAPLGVPPFLLDVFDDTHLLEGKKFRGSGIRLSETICTCEETKRQS